MAKKSISQPKKKRKKKQTTTHVPLCGLGAVLQEKQLFAEIHQSVRIDQKTIDYRPTDKLVFATLGIIAGAETVYDINCTLRPNKALLAAFGYDKCADQSVIQQTINAATSENICQLHHAIDQIWHQNNQTTFLINKGMGEEKEVTIDIDLSPLPISKTAEKSEKGYVAKKKNQYNRQLARVLVPATQEIVTQSIYPGNTLSLEVFQEMVLQMEKTLEINTQHKRESIRLRIDAGFGTDENINFALRRGYGLLAKMYSGNRAKVLARSVCKWEKVPSKADNTPREAGWVTSPHQYYRLTSQVAIRTPTKKGGYAYSILVTTNQKARLAEIVTDYDKRMGVCESTFCQDYQGLSLRKRRKNSFVAQTMLVLLSQLAHNLVVWMKTWLVDACFELLLVGEVESDEFTRIKISKTIKTIKQRGQKRFLRQILAINGKVVFKGKKVIKIVLNPLYPLIDRIAMAFSALLAPYKIHVSLDEN